MERLQGWTDWYVFARSALDYEHHEAETYAGKRYLEELNRDKLASGDGAAEFGTEPTRREGPRPHSY